VLVYKLHACGKAGMQRQAQVHAAFIDGKFDASGARVAHADNMYAALLGQVNDNVVRHRLCGEPL